MLNTPDGHITVHVTKNPYKVIYRPADWSIVDLPLFHKDASDLSDSLLNSPVSKHLCLVLNRNKRKEKITALCNLKIFEEKWNVLDFINIKYDKPASCSNNTLLPISESGFLLFKGSSPDIKKTSWFSDVYENSTNFWDVSTQPDEEKVYKSTYYKNFSWELSLLLYSLSGVLETRSFIYLAQYSESDVKSIYEFCKTYKFNAQIVCKSTSEAESLMLNILKG